MLNYLCRPSIYVTNKPKERPRKVSQRSPMRICQVASNGTMTCEKMKQDLNLQMHRSIVLKTIKRYIRAQTKKKTSSFHDQEQRQITSRLNSARNNTVRERALVQRFPKCILQMHIDLKRCFRSSSVTKKSSIWTVQMELTVIGMTYENSRYTSRSAISVRVLMV